MPEATPADWSATYTAHALNAIVALAGMDAQSRARHRLWPGGRALVLAWARVMRARVGQSPSEIERARELLARAEAELPAALAAAPASERENIRRRTIALRHRVEQEVRRVESLPASDRLRESVLDALRRARLELASALAAYAGVARGVARASGEGLAVGLSAVGIGTVAIAIALVWLFKKG